MKSLTKENWLKADPSILIFEKLNLRTGQSSSISQEEWAERFLRHKLSKDVPDEIVALFEVATGAMLYGYFFTPLYTLGLEQVFRVAEAAITAKCKQIVMSAKQMKKFESKIDGLVAAGILTADEGKRRHALRNMRNRSTHREQQEIWFPQSVLRILAGLVEDINQLFS